MEIYLAIIGLLFSFLFAGSEAAFTAFNRLRLEIWKKQNRSFIQPLVHFQKRPEDYFSTILFGNNVSNILATTFATVILITYMNKAVAWLLISLVILIFGEIVPKLLFRSFQNQVIRPATLLMFFFFALFSPLIRIINLMVEGFLSLIGIKHESTYDFFSRDELELLLKENNNKLGEERPEMAYITNILEFAGMKVREAMIPRTEMVAVPDTVTMHRLRVLFARHNLLHIPVYHENLDNVLGVVSMWDVFEQTRDVRECIHPLEVVPENASCTRLLYLFQQKNISVALVVDEYGGTAGLVTMDDLIDSMFGDFPEEFEEVPYIRALNKNTWIMDGRFPLDELEHKLGIDLPEGDYDTIAGLVLDKLGHIPDVGEVAKFKGFRVQVTRANSHRILEVKVIRFRHEKSRL